MIRHVRAAITLSTAVVLAGQLAKPCIGDQKSCGVEAAYGAMHALGITPDCAFVDLLTTEYISQIGGSTAQDVCNAVERLGAEATYLQGLGWASLLHAKHPMILHVSSDGQLEAANHWLLFLGVRDGMAKVVDGGGTPESWPLERLLVRWRGLAVVVTPPGQKDQASWLLNFYETMMSLSVAAVALAIAQIFRTVSFSRTLTGFAAAFLGVALTVAAFVIGVSGSYFPSPTQPSTRYAVAAIDGADFEIIDLNGFLSLMDDPGEATLLDCRYRPDSLKFPIPGTMNVPIDAKSHEMAEALSGKQPAEPIVIFCANKRCGFSERMAVRLVGMGFTNLKIFRGGYVEWRYRGRVEDLAS
jgi:rhodanese-related sulfurtransferase